MIWMMIVFWIYWYINRRNWRKSQFSDTFFQSTGASRKHSRQDRETCPLFRRVCSNKSLMCLVLK